MKTRLTLRVKKEYFDQIKSGEKTEEYRLVTPYWARRITIGMDAVTTVRVLLGYPKSGDPKKVLEFPYRGYEIKTITHPLFGSNPVEVFAIRVVK